MGTATGMATAPDGTPIGFHATGEGPPVLLVHGAARRSADVAGLVLYEPPPPETFADGVIESLMETEEAGDREGILRTFLLDVAGNDDEALARSSGRGRSGQS